MHASPLHLMHTCVRAHWPLAVLCVPQVDGFGAIDPNMPIPPFQLTSKTHRWHHEQYCLDQQTILSNAVGSGSYAAGYIPLDQILAAPGTVTGAWTSLCQPSNIVSEPPSSMELSVSGAVVLGAVCGAALVIAGLATVRHLVPGLY